MIDSGENQILSQIEIAQITMASIALSISVILGIISLFRKNLALSIITISISIITFIFANFYC